MITNVNYNKSRIQSSADYLMLKQDGEYEIEFRSLVDENITYKVNIIRDTMPPILSFDQEVTKEGVIAPLQYYPSDSSDSIYVYRKGIRYRFEENVLYKPGNYTIEVIDRAGNITKYDIFVKNSYSFAGGYIWYIVAAIIVLIIIWFVYTRKNYRVL